MDDVIPLGIRQITIPESDGEQQYQDKTDPPVVNWLLPLTCQQLTAAQKQDPVLSILHNWLELGNLPTKEQVTMESPAVRKYWLCWPQIELDKGVLFYRWENANNVSSLLLMVKRKS